MIIEYVLLNIILIILVFLVTFEFISNLEYE